MSKKGKCEDEREATRSPSPVPRSPRTQDEKGASKRRNPEGNQSIWKKEATTMPTVTRQCTYLSCDYWHPPEVGSAKQKQVALIAMRVLSCMQATVEVKERMEIRHSIERT